MDRETRKANLKKLRLTGVRRNDNSSLRKNLSDSSSISKYFKSPISKEKKPSSPKEINKSGQYSDVVTVMEPCGHPQDSPKELSKTKTRKRTSLTKFINKDEINIDNTIKNEHRKNDDDDFETPVKKVKKPTKLRKVRAASNRKRFRGKEQPDIKSSLMRSEQFFSKITSEYCKHENFSADEIHLALALSKSQIETSHTAYLDSEEDSVHKRVDSIDNGKLDNVQDILRQYGFRTVSSEVYNSLTTTFIPGARRRAKTKWANKFTALTLRDSKYQTKKLQIKINALMAQQVELNQLVISEGQKGAYSLLSNHLLKLQPIEPNKKVFADEHRTNLDEFYVKSLFEIANVQAGYLLKDWHAIEGRDMSPKHSHNKMTNFSSGMDLAFSDLEEHYGAKQNVHSTSQVEIALLKENHSCKSSILTNKDIDNLKSKDNADTEKICENAIQCVENSDHRSEITPELSNQKHSMSGVFESNSSITSKDNSESLKSLPSRIRVTSPNIFASSEDESEEIIALSMSSKNETTVNGEGDLEAPKIIEDIIDLTQEIVLYQPNTDSYVKHNEGAPIDNLMKNEEQINKSESLEKSNLNIKNTLLDQCDCKKIPITQIENLCTYSFSNKDNMDGVFDETIMRNIKVFKSPDITVPKTIKNIREKPLSFSRSKSDSFASISENINSSATTSSSLTSSIDKINEDEANSSEDCIVLSDDEINYSIWKADKREVELNRDSTKDAELTNCMEDHRYDNLLSILDVIEEQNALESNSGKLSIPDEAPFTYDKVPFEVPSECAIADRSTELLEFGILDNISEPFTQTSEILKTPTEQAKSIANNNTPHGLDDLLTGDISFSKIMGTGCFTETRSHTPSLQLCTYLPDEYEIEGRTYTACIITDSKPDFTQQTEAEILKQLYEFGIKPLKRKQAVKMLEYIYNSTHPLILEQTPDLGMQSQNEGNEIHEQSEKKDIRDCAATISPADTLQLKDCFGFNMRSFIHNLQLDFEFEEYIFQTNITKKTSRPLLPFHIAWYNLVSSSTILHETILMYKPIDLQEIFLFFKQLGYRYDPKDIKEFLDRRCIIFRYDLTQPDRQSNRHIRKSKTKSNKRDKIM